VLSSNGLLEPGPTFWDQKVLTIAGLEDNEVIASLVPNVGMNEAFMFMAGWGLAYNICSRSVLGNWIMSVGLICHLFSYWNVYTSCRKQGTSTITPLLYLLPFPASAAVQVFWMYNPSFAGSYVLNSHVLVPFLCSWGLQFAHQVGRMILAHVTHQPFPWWDSMWLWSIVAAIDANLPLLIGR
jgi:ethanolaminephosphotransferase